MSLAHHPATALFPMMDDAALAELADDIRKHGLQHPVVLYEGMVLDGRNRLAACERIGVVAASVQWDQNGTSPTEWVISTNLHRRHLTTSQRAAIAAEALPILEEEARERQRIGQERGRSNRGSGSNDPEPEPRRARDEAGEKFNVSGISVSRARRVKEKAPDLFEAVKEGRVTIAAAIREIGGEPSRSTQNTRRKPKNGRHPLPPPKRYAPHFKGQLVKWCRRVLPEDKPHLLAMSAEIHNALALLGLPCESPTLEDN